MNSDHAPSTILFTDASCIRPGDLDWVNQRGESFPVAGPRGRPIPLRGDNRLLARGIQFIAQKAKKLDPLDEPNHGMNVLLDHGMYRSWRLVTTYRRGKDLGSYSVDCPASVGIVCAESRDGFGWNERKPCSIRAPGQTGLDGFTVFIDSNGGSSERYKAVYCAHPPRTEWAALLKQYEQVPPRHRDTRILSRRSVYCVYAAVSPDGFHWRAGPKPLMTHMSDTDTTVHYDAGLGRYVMFTRLYWDERRSIARAEAADFWHWGPVSPFIRPTLNMAITDDIYLNARTEYPGVPAAHLMFPMIYHRDTQRSDVQLYTSAEGLCWSQVPGGPVLEPGPPGSWDSEFILAGKNLVPLGRDQVAVPYGGTPYPHKYPRWKPVLAAMKRTWAVWPKGRLVALHCPNEGAFAMTPLAVKGRRMHLNLRTTMSGTVQVEATVGGKRIPGRSFADCDPLTGDHLDRPVSWRGKTAIVHSAGTAVELRFRLRNADLYSVEFKPGP